MALFKYFEQRSIMKLKSGYIDKNMKIGKNEIKNRLISTYDVGFFDSSKSVEKLVSFIKFCVKNNELTSNFREKSRVASADFTRDNAQLLFHEIN